MVDLKILYAFQASSSKIKSGKHELSNSLMHSQRFDVFLIWKGAMKDFPFPANFQKLSRNIPQSFLSIFFITNIRYYT